MTIYNSFTFTRDCTLFSSVFYGDELIKFLIPYYPSRLIGSKSKLKINKRTTALLA